MGSTFDCADHSKSVCFFERAIISSPVMVCLRVSVAIFDLLWKRRCYIGFLRASSSLVTSWSSLFQHRIALRLELVAGLPVRHFVGLRHPLAHREQHPQILPCAAEVPVGHDDVERCVVPLLGPRLPRLLAELLRLADVVDTTGDVERRDSLLRKVEMIRSIVETLLGFGVTVHDTA